jgi:pimeloyl-ACP methyl ester carboxylesterase
MTPTLVLLPGMDGTGELFAPLRAVPDRGLAVVAVRYPPRALEYHELERRVRAELPPADPFIVLGESFSGPIALAIAAAPPSNLRAYVLCCSFARAPRPLLCHAWPLLALAWPAALRQRVVARMLLGRFGSASVERQLAQVLTGVPARTLARRARSVARLDVRACLERIRVPGLYLRASADALVPRECGEELIRHATRARIVDIEGPHALLQCRPAAVAAALAQFTAEVC